MPRPARRKFLAAGAALVAAPLAARAQRADRIHRIGFLSPTERGPRDEAFVAGLRELGYAEGRNVSIEMRFAEGRPERVQPLIDELLRLGIDVLVVGSTIGARAAKAATTTLPVVFAGSSDPVAGGIVPNLARPGGNLTGTSTAYGDGLAAKWLELLKDITPGASHVAVLWSSSNAAAAQLFARELVAAAAKFRTKVDVHQAANPAELDVALAGIATRGAKGLIVTPSPFAVANRDRLVRFAEEKRLPAIYFDESFVDAGGLVSYGPSIVDAYRRAAAYVDRILKGARPGDLAVEQPTKFDLVVNRTTAKTLGVTIPAPFLLRADRVVE